MGERGRASVAIRCVRHDRVVPRISELYGIVIEMYFGDHPPPHFHARYSGDEALIVIESGEVFAGFLPGRRSGWFGSGSGSTGPSSWQTGIERVPNSQLNPWRRCHD